MKRVEYEVEGERVRGDLHQPPGRQARKRPLIILVHGLSSTRKEYFDFPERLAARGYAVLAIDFRGHGDSEGQRGFQSKPRALADIRGALEAVRDEYAVDPDRWALAGHSLGATLAIASAPYLPTLTCLIAMAPPWRLRAEMNPFEFAGYNLARIANLPARRFRKDGLYVPYKVDYGRLFTDPRSLARAREADFLQKTLPVKNYAPLVRDLDGAEAARAVQIPTLVLVAERDIVVGKYNSRKVYEALAGPKEFHEIRGSGHSMCSDGQSETVLAHCADFLDHHLKGAPA